MTPIQWLFGNDTGISSKTLLAAMLGEDYEQADVPLDAADFGRCWRLLALFPDWRARLHEVPKRFPKWGPMVAIWPELETLYKAYLIERESIRESFKAGPALLAFLKKINSVQDDCMRAAGWVESRPGSGSWSRGKASKIKVGESMTIETEDALAGQDKPKRHDKEDVT